MCPKILLVDHLLEERKNLKKVENLFVILFMSLNAAMYAVSAFNSDEFVSKFIPSAPFHIGIHGYTRKITDIACMLGILLALSNLINYNYTPNKSGFKLFRALKGKTSSSTIGLNPRLFQKLQNRAKDVVKLCQLAEFITNCVFTIALTLTFAFVLNKTKQSWSFLLLTFGFALTISSLCWHFLLPPLVHLYVTSHYLLLRIQNLKKTLEFFLFIETEIKQKLVSTLLAKHDLVCKDIAKYGKFWKVFYFFVLLFMVPYNLLLLHALLFGDISGIFIPCYLAVFLTSAVYIFIIGMYFAKLSHQVHATRKNVYKILQKCIRNQRLSQWSKLMSCVERLSNPKRPVGFTCLTIFTVTYASFFKVIKKLVFF